MASQANLVDGMSASVMLVDTGLNHEVSLFVPIEDLFVIDDRLVGFRPSLWSPWIPVYLNFLSWNLNDLSR